MIRAEENAAVTATVSPACPGCGRWLAPESGLVWPDAVVTVVCRHCPDVVVLPADQWPTPRA